MTIPVDPPPQPSPDAAPVSCAYCWEPIPAALFTDSPWEQGQLSAQCPGCDLPVTLSTVT
jgi:hypothetical protein